MIDMKIRWKIYEKNGPRVYKFVRDDGLFLILGGKKQYFAEDYFLCVNWIFFAYNYRN
jgi:hypothetical protein